MKTVCSRHEIAYEAGGSCTYCQGLAEERAAAKRSLYPDNGSAISAAVRHVVQDERERSRRWFQWAPAVVGHTHKAISIADGEAFDVPCLGTLGGVSKAGNPLALHLPAGRRVTMKNGDLVIETVPAKAFSVPGWSASSQGRPSYGSANHAQRLKDFVDSGLLTYEAAREMLEPRESFFGIDWGVEPAKTAWEVRSPWMRLGDDRLDALNYAFKPTFLAGKVEVFADPACPPNTFYVAPLKLEPLRPDDYDYGFKVTAKFYDPPKLSYRLLNTLTLPDGDDR